MFGKLLQGIKNFFADDPEDLGPEELVALVLDKEAPEARRQEGARCLSEVSDKISEMPASESVKAAASNRMFTSLCAVLGQASEPAWLRLGAIRGMNEIANISRYDMDAAVIESGVDPLIACLGASHGDEIRGAAAMCLSSLDDKLSDETAAKAIEALVGMVRESSGEVRGDALFSWGCFGDGRASHLWAEAATYLDDPSAEVRAQAASAVHMIGNEDPDPAVIDRLVELVESDANIKVKDNAVDALGHLGGNFAEKVVPPLTAALRNHELRHMAIYALMEFKEAAASAVPELARFIDDEDHEDSVVSALQAIGTEEARKILRDNGHDEEEDY